MGLPTDEAGFEWNTYQGFEFWERLKHHVEFTSEDPTSFHSPYMLKHAIDDLFSQLQRHEERLNSIESRLGDPD